MRLLALGACFLAATAVFAQNSLTVGNIRVQILSPTLVRIEQKGPKGFEDRETFHVVGRRGWPGAQTQRARVESGSGIDTKDWKLRFAGFPLRIQDVRILDSHSHLIWQFDGKLVNSAWIPAPGKMPKAWAIADSPRMIPSKFGLTPSGTSDPQSGWDTGNNAPDVYIFLPNGSYEQLRRDFLKLTGPIEMPPLYALGYTDSKYYAYQQDEALKRIDEYRRRQIPLDTFVVDTDWRIGGSHGYSVDTRYFPDMATFLKAAHEKHAHIMFNDHPEPQAKGALDPKELQYRFDGLGGLLREGVDIWWYDRNWGVSLVNPAPGLRHEVWGMKLYHDITQRVRPDQRPLIMSNVDGIDNGYRNRPPEIVTHRYPVQWTGDTSAQWGFLRRGVENAVFEGVEGLNPWVNEDLGGHVGRTDPDLYVRYLEYGSVCPFMRVHCTKGQTREPWAYGPDAEKIVPEYIRMRYRLMPLFYAAARNAYDTGTPLLQRCDLQYPGFKEATADDQFLIGDSLLIAPIVGGHDPAAVPENGFPSGLKGEYFDNRALAGDPVLTRLDKAINFNWGTGSPDPKVPTDDFSARWTGKVTAPSDHPYRLALTADDGCRLWIDGQLVIDKWVAQDGITTTAPTILEPGSTHDLKIEYMEIAGNAMCVLRWQAVTGKTETSERNCWIPPGTWTDVWTGSKVQGPRSIAVHSQLSQMPTYLRAGAIIPLAPDVQWTGQKDWSAITLDVMPGNGATSLYEDDGSSLGYKTGQFRRTPIRVNQTGSSLILSIGAASGRFSGAVSKRTWKIRVFLPKAKSVYVDGKRAAWRTVSAASNQPFRNSGGEPTGSIVEVTISDSSVAKSHRMEVRE